MKLKKAIFPGSFDPITKGHINLIQRGVELFDELIIAIGINSSKKNLFSLETRMNWIKQCCVNYPQVTVLSYSGLTVDFCEQHGVHFILRGLRSSTDFEYEKAIAAANRKLNLNVETVFLSSEAEFHYVSSSIVREMIQHRASLESFVPEEIIYSINEHYQKSI